MAAPYFVPSADLLPYWPHDLLAASDVPILGRLSQLAGVTDVNRARDLIGKTAQLEFYDLEGDLVPPSISRGIPIPNDGLYPLLSGQQSSIQEGGGKEWRVFEVKSKKVIAGPFPTKKAAENSEKFKEGGKDVRALGVPKNRIVLTCSADSAVICPPAARSSRARPSGSRLSSA